MVMGATGYLLGVGVFLLVFNRLRSPTDSIAGIYRGDRE